MTDSITKVVTGEVRFSFVHVFEPQAWGDSDNKTEKYSVHALIPKSDTATIKKIKAAIQAAYTDGAGVLKGNGKSIPPLESIWNPLRDGDTYRPDDEAYRNHYFIKASSSRKPGLIYQNGVPITDETDFYSGCYGRVSVNFFAFSTRGNRGVSCWLNNILKLRDGEALGGGASAADDFAEFIEQDTDNDFLD